MERKTALRSLIVGLAVNSIAAGSELLPPDMNPVEVGYEARGLGNPELVTKAIEVFDSVGSSKRHYDHVDQLDGLTIGLGHWPQSKLSNFFHALASDRAGETFAALSQRLYEYYESNPDAWRSWSAAGHLENPALNIEAVRSSIQATLLNDRFMEQYAINCKRNSSNYCGSGPSFYNDHPGIIEALKLALRDPLVVDWQMRYWEEDVLNPAEKKAVAAGIPSIAGVVGMASMESSAPSWANNIVNEAHRGYITNDKEQIEWKWNVHPFIAEPTVTELESWRLLVRWQYYCSKKGKVRNRSQKYFALFLADTWKVPIVLPNGHVADHPNNWDPTLVKQTIP